MINGDHNIQTIGELKKRKRKSVAVKVARLPSRWKLLAWILDTEKTRPLVVVSKFLY